MAEGADTDAFVGIPVGARADRIAGRLAQQFLVGRGMRRRAQRDKPPRMRTGFAMAALAWLTRTVDRAIAYNGRRTSSRVELQGKSQAVVLLRFVRRLEHALQRRLGDLGEGRADLGLLRRRHPGHFDRRHAGLADAAQQSLAQVGCLQRSPRHNHAGNRKRFRDAPSGRPCAARKAARTRRAGRAL